MKKRRQPWLLLVGLGLLAGCTGEESNPAPPVVPESAPRPVTSATRSAAPTTGKPAAGTADTNAPASSPAASKDSAAPSLEGPKADAGQSDSMAVKLTDGEVANIKKLPASEQEAALKQLLCPISGDHLGAMGMPFKVSALDRTFYLCCKGCEDDVKSDPKGAIAKLDKK